MSILKAIILLGAPNDDKGNLSSIALERCGQALLESVKSPDAMILLTGGWGDHFNTTDKPHAHYLKNYLTKNNVAISRFLPHVESRNTVEDAALAKPILLAAGIKFAIIVTSDFHTPRAKYIFEHTIPEITFSYSPSTTHLSTEELKRLRAHETAAIARLKQSFEGNV